MRVPVIAANWKMNKNPAETEHYFRHLSVLVNPGTAEIVICPPAPLLQLAGELCRRHGFRLGAQNMHWENAGAFTGEISPLLLRDLGVQYVIVGHSERRQLFAETDHDVARKVKAALFAELIPIICVGETMQQRQAGKTGTVVDEQLTVALGGLDPSQVRRLVVAYEPVWAIGSGIPASGSDAEEVAVRIRKLVVEMFSLRVARDIRIQYGGSVNAQNAAEFLSSPEIDGALVGGASLDAAAFAGIANTAAGVEVT